MPTRIQKDAFCSLQPCLGLVKTRAKNAKRLFPPIMADVSEWAGAQPADAVFQPFSAQKSTFPKLVFFIFRSPKIPSKVCEACFRPYLFFFTPFGYGGGGSPKGLVHNLLMRFFTLYIPKREVFETCVFDTVIT